MAESMIKRVARAICCADRPRECNGSDCGLSACLDEARAAIAALRDPTGRMWVAGRSRFAHHAERYRQQVTSEAADIHADTAPDDIWRAMIDAALKED